jgi:hypothetical protein
MRRFILLGLLLLTLFLLTGCGNKPQTTAKEFLTSVSVHNYTFAGQYVAMDSKKELNLIKERFDDLSTAERQDLPKKKFRITNILTEGNHATVEYEVTYAKVKGVASTEDPYNGKLTLQNIDGVWKVILEPGSQY